MNIIKTINTEIKRFICFVMISLLIFTGAISSVQAAIVSTHDLVLASSNEQARENRGNSIQRSDIQQQLVLMGVDAEQVLARVNSMSNSEIQELSGLMEQKPAGSGVIGLIGFVLVVLLITDLLNLTNIYNF